MTAPTAVFGHLGHLESAGLIRLARFQPDLEYLFRHALVQDAAYASLLPADQKQLHKVVGHTMEGLYAGRLDQHAAQEPEVPDALTPREIEVLERVVAGDTNQEIGEALCITENTVKAHLRGILEKLHLRNRIQAAVYAVREGLVSPSLPTH